MTTRQRRSLPERSRQLGRSLAHRARRRLAYGVGRLDGLAYRLARRHPDLEPGDAVLVDRVRSSLGRVERRLDIPHVHVLVHEGGAVLHGEVPEVRDVLEVVRAAGSVPGFTWVESRLHVGLVPSDTRPSTGGHRRAPSPARRRLVDAAVDALGDGDRPRAELVVAAVVGAFLHRLPPGERAHVLVHLPHDVLDLVEPCGAASPASELRTIADLVGVAARAVPGVEEERLHRAALEVLHTLQAYVPEEAGDVAAVLPVDLVPAWREATAR